MQEKFEETATALELGATHHGKSASKWRPASTNQHREPLADISTNTGCANRPDQELQVIGVNQKQDATVAKKQSAKDRASGAKVVPVNCNNDTPKLLQTQLIPPSIFDSESKTFKLLTARVRPGKAIQLSVKSVGKLLVLTTCSGEFICAAKDIGGACSTQFTLSLSNDNFQSKEYLMGSLQSNFLGSLFQLSNHVDPASTTTIKFTGGCRIVPAEVRHLEVNLTDPLDMGKSYKLLTEQPQYDYSRKTYTLNMHGCAKMSSVNNLKLKDTSSNKNAFLLGKEAENNYNVLLWHPLSPLVGFSIALSCLSFKLITM